MFLIVRHYRSLGPLVLVASTVAALPAMADDGILTDVRLGILAHDVPVLGRQMEHGADVNAEAQFESFVPESALTGIAPDWRWLLRPAPHIGVDGNTGGFTSQLYFGLTWTVNLDNGGVLWPDRAVFLAIGFGGAFNNGHIHEPDTTEHLKSRLERVVSRVSRARLSDHAPLVIVAQFQCGPRAVQCGPEQSRDSCWGAFLDAYRRHVLQKSGDPVPRQPRRATRFRV